MERKEYKVTIFGQEYSIVSDESEQNVTLIEKEVNGIFSLLSERTGTFSENQLAVLASLQLASKVITCRKQCRDYEDAVANIITLIDTLICADSSAE